MTGSGEIKKTLQDHEKRISKLEKLVKSKPISSISGEKIILNFINSGFFNSHKKMGELKKELKKQAKLDKGANYSEILEKLTRENKLSRKMIGHQWVYKKIAEEDASNEN